MLSAQKQLQEFIKSNALFKPTDKILLAVSGGKDSVAMVHLFRSLGFSFGIAHCNFNLRGQETIRDQEFVRSLAKALKTDFHLKSFDTQKFAEKNKISTQMAARDLRYAYFEEIRKGFDYKKIAVAQHQNDAMETVLLNLIRGTGIAGLHGIKADRNNIIRPMLCFTADDILKLVKENDWAFVEDSSNASNKYIRNKIRMDIIPEMEKINPSLAKTFDHHLKYFSDLEAFLNSEVAKIKADILIKNDRGYQIERKAIQNLKPQKLLLYEVLKDFSFNETSITDLINALNGIPGKQFFSDTHHIILDRENIIIHKIENKHLSDLAVFESDLTFQFDNYRFKQNKLTAFPSSFTSNENTIFVDQSLLVYPLKLRFWQQGDVFKPFGMKGVKKISDFFINQKVNVKQKASIPILINGDGKIIWVCGLRGDDRFKVRSNTKKIIIFEVEKP
ncbi:tRNA lysidine(34) synthetase TilS [Pedobacter sp. SD-b]|uniref:tRNA(Ile)-lysidine synthase n=1 Tax=Pedobacter segetis TaxID=2793069 RepID=A0ABS1BER9_9SPHI|nr:tRNA lysidine(34) synthetase TilS [Pedobacter segetis]MBK0381361.1 tRNA lysidine(34) synthetase TilS [Pedobacter segetis]